MRVVGQQRTGPGGGRARLGEIDDALGIVGNGDLQATKGLRLQGAKKARFAQLSNAFARNDAIAFRLGGTGPEGGY